MTLSVPILVAAGSLSAALLSRFGYISLALRAGILLTLLSAALRSALSRSPAAHPVVPGIPPRLLAAGVSLALVAGSAGLQMPVSGGLPPESVTVVHGVRIGQERGRPGSWSAVMEVTGISSWSAEVRAELGRLRLWSESTPPAAGSQVSVAPGTGALPRALQRSPILLRSLPATAGSPPGPAAQRSPLVVNEHLVRVGPGPVGALLHRIRAGLRRGLVMQTQADTGLAHALVLGDRDGLDPGLSRSIRTAGLSHVLALSGMHLGLVAAAAALVAGAVRLRGLRIMLPLACAGAFVVLAGISPSLLRALLMLGLYTAFRLSGLPARPAAVLPLAFAAQLALQPLQIADLGFLLSWAAVAGIALVLGLPAWRRLGRVPAALLLPLAVSLGAWLATAPLVLLAFGRLPLSGLLLSLAAGPLVSVLMLAALATLCLPGAFGPAVFGALARGLQVVAGLGARMPALVTGP